MVKHYVIGISGASGIVLGFKTIIALLNHSQDIYVHIVMSKSARYTALEEMGKSYPNATTILEEIPKELQSRCYVHNTYDFGAPIASGSFITQAMAIVPCSMATLAAVTIGLSDSLLRRAADVTLKEKRRLVLVPREAPFSSIHLENMLMLSRIGASIIVPQPAWYTRPKSIEDVEAHIVGRILDSLGIYTEYSRWEGSSLS